MGLFAWAVKSLYLPRKIDNSLPLAKSLPREPLPENLGYTNKHGYPSKDLLEAVNEICGKLKYRSDPVNGLIDLYNHPEYTQYLLNTGNYEGAINDCDDFASYAQALLLKSGVHPSKVWEWNILVPWHKQLSQGKWNHVLCGFSYWDGSKEWTGVIDTNTAANGAIFWAEGSAKEAEAAIIQWFRSIYPAQYYKLVRGRWVDYLLKSGLMGI